MNRDEKSAAIVRAVTAPSYSHAENIFRLLNTYEQEHGLEKAVDLIYEEVVGNDGVCTDTM